MSAVPLIFIWFYTVECDRLCPSLCVCVLEKESDLCVCACFCRIANIRLDDTDFREQSLILVICPLLKYKIFEAKTSLILIIRLYKKNVPRFPRKIQGSIPFVSEVWSP